MEQEVIEEELEPNQDDRGSGQTGPRVGSKRKAKFDVTALEDETVNDLEPVESKPVKKKPVESKRQKVNEDE